MASWKKLLLEEAARRFEEQKREQEQDQLGDDSVATESAAVVQYMAPISPSPPALIDAALARLGQELNDQGEPLIGGLGQAAISCHPT